MDSSETYIKHYGILASKYKLEQLVNEAIQSVDFLGEDARTLKEIAQYIGNRIS